MRRVGRHDQDAAAAGRFGDGSRRRARRFADAAFAAEKNEQGLGTGD
jgi:hypothetical protein